jgi:putative lysine/arginine/ornithine/histidine/octopine transport system substrate-binding protein
MTSAALGFDEVVMKAWLWAGLLLTVAGVPQQASAEATAPAAATAGIPGVVRIGTLVSYPPFEYSSSDGNPKGMEIELGKRYCALAHLQCSWVTLPFTQLIPALLDHRVDAVLAQLSVTAAREKEVSFTAPVTLNSVVVVGPKGSSITEDPETMRGKTIGVGAESVELAWAQSHLQGIATVKAYEDGQQELRDLRAHKLDAIISDQPGAYDFLREGGKFDFTYLGRPLNDPMILGTGDTAIALRKDDVALLDAFNAAINSVREDGTFEKVSGMYFPFSMQPK